MWRHPWFAAVPIVIFPLLAVATLPEIPNGAEFVYHIDGDAIIDKQLVPKNISGWGKHPGTRWPEPCLPLIDTGTGTIYTFQHLRMLALNVAFWDIPIRDDEITFEFFQDNDCRVQNHPRMLYRRGEYILPELLTMRIGSFRLIDPLGLAFIKKLNPNLSRVEPWENALLKTEEVWERDRRLFEEMRTDLLARNLNRICTICLQSLVEQRPSTVLLGNCGHAYHNLCLEQWMSANPEGSRREPVQFKARNIFPLVQMTSCPDCRTLTNPRKMARIPTQGVESNQLNQVQNQFQSPERQGDVENNRSPTIGLPSLFTSPGSDLDDLLNLEYMDERENGRSGVQQPANFQSNIVGNNPLVQAGDYTGDVLEGPRAQRPADLESNANPLVPPTDYDFSVSEGLSDFNGIGRSLRSGQLG